jgi:hypothetical protein
MLDRYSISVVTCKLADRTSPLPIFQAALHLSCFTFAYSILHSHLVRKAPMEWSKHARPSLFFLPLSPPLAPSIHHYPHRHKITSPQVTLPVLVYPQGSLW